MQKSFIFVFLDWSKHIPDILKTVTKLAKYEMWPATVNDSRGVDSVEFLRQLQCATNEWVSSLSYSEIKGSGRKNKRVASSSDLRTVGSKVRLHTASMEL